MKYLHKNFSKKSTLVLYWLTQSMQSDSESKHMSSDQESCEMCLDMSVYWKMIGEDV